MGEIERQWVSEMYPGKGWKERVRRMSDPQVVAIFLREKNKPKQEEPKDSKESADEFPF